MPKLGLGIDATVKTKSFKSLSLYSDSLIAYPTSGYTFVNRQFFSSSLASNINYGSGKITQTIGASGRHLLVHFNCDKINYSTYNNGIPYGLDSIVYGGEYGHALFKRTGNPGNPGFAPNFLFTPVSTQDARGWTRYKPVLPGIKLGQELQFNFNIILNTAGASLSTVNSIRFGLFDSSSAVYINSDNLSGSSTSYNNYSGYLFTISSASLPSLNQRIYARVPPSLTLINAISSFTDKIAQSITGVSGDVDYYVSIRIRRSGQNSINLKYSITGAGLGGNTTLSFEDTSPASYAFDTFVVFASASSCNSFTLSNISPNLISSI